MHQKNVCFVIIGVLKKFVYNKCHVLMTAYELKKHCNIECKRCWLFDYNVFYGVLPKMKLFIF